NYLWPLLIVLFAGLLPQERLKPHHLAGAFLGLIGTIVLVASRAHLGFAEADTPGFAAAFVAAFVWATYSVLSRHFATVPTDVVTGLCLVTAVLAGLFHLAFEETAWPAGAGEWLATIGLGIGPV